MSADTLQMSSNSLPMPQGRCGCCHHFSVKSQTRAGWITWPSENWSWGFTPDFRSDCSHRVIPEQRITIVVIFWSFRFIFEGCSKAPWERGLDRTTAPDRFQQPEAISRSSPEAAFPTAAIRFGPRVSRQKLQSPCAFRAGAHCCPSFLDAGPLPPWREYWLSPSKCCTGRLCFLPYSAPAWGFPRNRV